MPFRVPDQFRFKAAAAFFLRRWTSATSQHAGNMSGCLWVCRVAGRERVFARAVFFWSGLECMLLAWTLMGVQDTEQR